MIKHKFSQSLDAEFASVLKSKVNDYFKETSVSKKANPQMVWKSVLLLLVYIGPIIFILSGIVTDLIVLAVLWGVMGLGKSFVGTSVMHDALHGSYSKNRSVNFLMGISANILGISSRIWKIQHNVLHHTYTNIEHADEDIQPRYVMRFSPNQPRRWFHSYQFIYASFFYSISTLTWVTYKDYYKLFDYKKKGLIKDKTEVIKLLVVITFQKAVYFGIFLVLPIILLPYAVWVVVLMFVAMHMITGLLLSFIFQTAHVMPTSEFIDTPDENLEVNWWVHQLRTTSNYAMNNKFLSWLLGGLNFQIEHHLFPNVCHVHYPKISKIVQSTAKEYNIPYYFEKNFRTAIWNHLRMLKNLGKA